VTALLDVYHTFGYFGRPYGVHESKPVTLTASAGAPLRVALAVNQPVSSRAEHGTSAFRSVAIRSKLLSRSISDDR